MKYLPILLLSSLALSSVTGQEYHSKETRKADKAFDEFSYAKAAKLYESYLPSNDSSYILPRLSDSYLNLNESGKAAKYLKRTVAIANIDPSYYYKYGEVLLAEQKYDEAKIWYRKYNETTRDQRSISKLSGINDINQFFADSANYSVSKTNFNSSELDFSPAFYKEGVVFVSSRPASSTKVNASHTVSNIYNWDKTPYLDLYLSLIHI